MYAPLRLAQALEAHTGDGVQAYFSTTTRSPVLAVDDPGYAIRSRLVFPAHDDPTDGGSPERYAYNVAGGGFDAVLCVVDSAGDTPALHAPAGCSPSWPRTPARCCSLSCPPTDRTETPAS